MGQHFSIKEPPQQQNPPLNFWEVNNRIVMTGLDASGKTSMIFKLKLAEYKSLIPMIGFSYESAQYKNFNIQAWDEGGSCKISRFYKYVYLNAKAFIYVVDVNDVERLIIAKEILQELLTIEELRNIPLLVYANKQDKRAITSDEIAKEFGLVDMKDINWKVQGSCAITGDGLTDGLKWIVKEILAKKK